MKQFIEKEVERAFEEVKKKAAGQDGIMTGIWKEVRGEGKNV